MWLLSFVPDWVYYAVFVVGFIGILSTIFLKFIPPIYIFKTQIQAVSIVLMILSSFFVGMKFDNMIWEAQAEELKKKLAIAEEKSKEENTKIVEKVVTKTKVIREKGDNIVKYVDREITKYDSKCEIPKEFVKAHNDSAEGDKK